MLIVMIGIIVAYLSGALASNWLSAFWSLTIAFLITTGTVLTAGGVAVHE